MATCPFLGKCKQKVSLEFYIDVCSNALEDKYKTCPTYKQLTVEQKTPDEWRKLIFGQ